MRFSTIVDQNIDLVKSNQKEGFLEMVLEWTGGTPSKQCYYSGESVKPRYVSETNNRK